MASSSSSGGQQHQGTAHIDDLLARVRELQKILPDLTRHGQRTHQNQRPSRAQTDGAGEMGRGTAIRTPHMPFSPPGRERDAIVDEPPFIRIHHQPLNGGWEDDGHRMHSAGRHPDVPVVRNILRDVDDADRNVDFMDDAAELLRMVTFIRVVVDSLNWEGKPPDLFKQHFGRPTSPRLGQLVLDYEFPTPDADQSLRMLRKRVRTYAKTVLPRVAHFNHRQVALVQITPAVVQLWTKTRLTLRVYYELPHVGKFATRHVGKCEIDLSSLLVPPFSINVNAPLDVVGLSCRGHLKVSIQLGSRNASFAERVEALRAPSKSHTPDPYRFVDPNLLSARLERQASPPADFDQAPAPRPISARPMLPEGLRPRIDLDSRRVDFQQRQRVDTDTQSTGAQTDSPGGLTDSSGSEADREQRRATARSRTRDTVADRLRRQSSDTAGYRMQLTVHSARRLPLVKGTNHERIRPSVFVSYRGDQDELKTSAVVPESTDPVWEWTSEFTVPPKRKNVVLKFWHRSAARDDRALGFVGLDLPSTPPSKPIKGTYDLIDLSQSSTGRVKLTLCPLEPSPRKQLLSESPLADSTPWRSRAPIQVDTAVNTSMLMPRSPPRRPPLSPIEPYLEMASRSLLADQLRTNMEQLGKLMRRLPQEIL